MSTKTETFQPTNHHSATEKPQGVNGSLLKSIQIRFLDTLDLSSRYTVIENGEGIAIKEDISVAELNKLLDEGYTLYIGEKHNLYEFIKNGSYERIVVQNSAIGGGMSLKISSKGLPKIQ